MNQLDSMTAAFIVQVQCVGGIRMEIDLENWDDLSYQSKVIVLDAIQQRLQNIKKSLNKQRESSRKCSHPEVVDITTMIDMGEGFRKKMCKECRETWTVSIKEE